MKQINNYICIVDYGRPSYTYNRNTSGRYRVGAKTEKEAEKLLRDEIKFGSIQVYYKDNTVKIGYKQIIKEI